MFTSLLFTTVLASSAVLVQAIVQPNEPAPGTVFKQGATCHIAWGPDDTGSKTDWKGMAIELMTGPNNPMIHVTTVAQNQDGSVAGNFDYPCPEVNPNSDIYFYQFSSPAVGNFTWTGRFTIAAADGSTTPPTETEQSATGPIKWGKGALVDAASAVAAPSFQGTTPPPSGGASNSASGSGAGASVPPPASSSSKPVVQSNTRAAATTSSGSGKSAGAAAQVSPTGSSAAVAGGPMGLGAPVWPLAAVMTVSAMAFTLFL
ncbi:hypothetical protein B0H15DRAFT_779812 [Mycena belliarum]|uniref:Yeast cell wall synthesis Kre9/Knh1-like N-terminal domain-containing protein n=1 Tax=Mycena belliarum TaxID=1033014 RepID=A0AAD6U4P4_9AGAR|nr:hypothetical protein B0H15DRAFT_779812 [Mycena belliae]